MKRLHTNPSLTTTLCGGSMTAPLEGIACGSCAGFTSWSSWFIQASAIRSCRLSSKPRRATWALRIRLSNRYCETFLAIFRTRNGMCDSKSIVTMIARTTRTPSVTFGSAWHNPAHPLTKSCKEIIKKIIMNQVWT